MMFGTALILSALAVSVSALWPLPRNLQSGTSFLRLSPAFSIDVDIANAPSDLYDAVGRTVQYLYEDHLERLVVGRGQNDSAAILAAPYLSTLALSLEKGASVQSISTEAVAPVESRDESYTLTIPSNGSGATLIANTTLGLLRGLTTFQQLFYVLPSDYAVIYAIDAPYYIEDSALYPWRGLELDTSRNFFPVADILRTLDTMELVKINTFHWHIVDSQSFPLVVSGYEELSTAGAYSPSSVYTSSDVQNVVAYAAARGIDVVLEIDTPGHEAAVGLSHPEYTACFYETPWASYANEPPAGQLRFPDPAVANFTAGLFKAVTELLPSSYFSTGGDEINVPCYTDDIITQQILNSTGLTLNGALNEYIGTTHGAVVAAGKTPVVWEEMVLTWNLTLYPDTVVLVWISSDDVLAVAEKGFRIVHAASNYFYMDCGGGGWVGDYPAGDSWCDPFKTWQYMYTFDPLANLTTEQYPLILGGEALLWTEQSSPSNLDPIVWPRAASPAEVFWTSAQNLSQALPRLHDVAYRMVQRGTNAIALQPEWCAIRPGACDLTA